MSKIRLILLWPVGLIYGVIGLIRRRIRKHRYQPEILTICVGNLAVGGTGKTPMIEYLVRQLGSAHKVGTLSRGYKRATEGFLSSLQEEVNAETFGDEPTQIHQKFPDIEVAVCESRVEGVKRMLATPNAPNLILLDDAYQHIAIKSAVNLILTDYTKPYTEDFPLPAGHLREFPCAAREADAIVVTKCPPTLTRQEANAIQQKLNVSAQQQCFFSTIRYQPPQPVTALAKRTPLNESSTVFLLTGIANPKPLYEKMSERFSHIIPIQFTDHHNFSKKELESLRQKVAESKHPCAVMTTEKDWWRMQREETAAEVSELPVFVVGIEMEFLLGGGEPFGRWLEERIKKTGP